ncbi:MAG: phytase, partial [Anaerolineae bacterium]|nr:phytase [Anaerolineae bacterium]
MYVSPITGRYYAFTNRDSVLNQYELVDNGSGRVAVNLVRTVTFGSFVNLTEGVTADDVHAKVYVSEEAVAIWKLGAEPTDGNTKVTVDKPIAQGGHFQPDIEGLTIYYKNNGTGYLIGSSQGNSTYTVYTREGNNTYLGTFNIAPGSIDGVSGTDGIDVTNFPLGPNFPNGVFIAQDGSNTDGNVTKNQNFKLVPFESIAGALNLTMDTSWDPRLVGATISPSPVTISGTVGVADATLSYTDGTLKTVTSSANGSYSFLVPYNWSGTVTPSHTCFTFNPINRSYSNITANQTSQNYTATFNPASGCTNIDVLIAGSTMGSYTIPVGGSRRESYTGVDNGPVQIVSTNAVSSLAAMRVIWKELGSGA